MFELARVKGTGSMWLRLTGLFGPPDELVEIDHIICASIGPILRAQHDHLLSAPLPHQLTRLLDDLAVRERGSMRLARGVTPCQKDHVLILDVGEQRNAPAAVVAASPPPVALLNTSNSVASHKASPAS
jgi:hypothetical protein